MPATSGLPQPTEGARTGAQVSANSPATARAMPARSSCGLGPRLSVSRSRDSPATASPTGTLSQKIHCQDSPWTIAPPTTGPVATPSPVMPPQSPMAAPRFSAGNASLISVRVSGTSIAAPAPWTTRAAMSIPAPDDMAANADPATNVIRPSTYIRWRPNRSPSAAPVSIRAPNTRL